MKVINTHIHGSPLAWHSLSRLPTRLPLTFTALHSLGTYDTHDTHDTQDPNDFTPEGVIYNPQALPMYRDEKWGKRKRAQDRKVKSVGERYGETYR